MPLNQAKQALIALAVNELAKTHEYDSITVDMICSQANISRSGFYRTFEDKYAVVAWCERLPLEQGIRQIGRTFSIEQGIKVACDGFNIFWDMFESTKNSIERRQRERSGIDSAYQYFCETATEYHNVKMSKELDYQALWSARGTMLAIRERSKDQDLQELAHLIACSFPAELAQILNDPVKPTSQASLDIKSLMFQ